MRYFVEIPTGLQGGVERTSNLIRLKFKFQPPTKQKPKEKQRENPTSYDPMYFALGLGGYSYTPILAARGG